MISKQFLQSSFSSSTYLLANSSSTGVFPTKKWDLHPTKRKLTWKEQPSQILLYINKTQSESSFFGSQLISKYLISKHNISKIMVEKSIYNSLYSLLKVENNQPSLFEPTLSDAVKQTQVSMRKNQNNKPTKDQFFEEEILYQDRAKIVEMNSKLKLTLKDFEKNFDFFKVSEETKRPCPSLLHKNDFVVTVGGGLLSFFFNFSSNAKHFAKIFQKDGTVLHMHENLFDCSAPFFPPIVSFCAKKSLGFLLPHRLANFETSIDKVINGQSTITSRSRLVGECFRERSRNKKKNPTYKILDVRGRVVEAEDKNDSRNKQTPSRPSLDHYNDVVHSRNPIDQLAEPVSVPEDAKTVSEEETRNQLRYDCISRHRALNEVVVHRGNCTAPCVFLFSVCEEKKSSNSIFREGGGVYQISQNAKRFIKARGDGILISSSTGSTGYNLSNQVFFSFFSSFHQAKFSHSIYF